MLQIISGKFFKEGSKRFSHEAKSILYSNYSYFQAIDTCIAKLEPVDTPYRGVTPYVISYVNQIEYEEIRPGTIAQVGDTEIIQQFQLLCTFGLRCFFDIEKSHIEINCREHPKNSGDIYIPSNFVSRFFDTEIRGNREETEYFTKFIDKVIGLPRTTYEAVIRFFKNFSDALQVLNYNFDLAYSMLVYALESLSQNFDKFKPTWEDYDQNIRTKLDKCFSQVDQKIYEEVQKILLESSHLKLQKRFISFISMHITETFFTSEAIGISNALKKSELEQVLINAYIIRSKYSHKLLPIQEHLKIKNFAQGEVFNWKNKPLLTFNGLVRLTYHVIHNFIQNQPYLESEKYKWDSQLPGVIQVKMAPEYWIWQAKKFDSSQAHLKLTGFLSHLANIIITDKKLVNLDDLMQVYEKDIHTAKEKDKVSMLAFYHIYNSIIHEKRAKYQNIIEKNKKLFNKCCMESLLVNLIIDEIDWRWDVEECVECYLKYQKQRYSEKYLVLPFLFELSILLEIANNYLRNNNYSKYQEWMNNACLEAAGQQKLQVLINETTAASKELKIHELIEFFKGVQHS